jgi:O-antigen biosynthesis protein
MADPDAGSVARYWDENREKSCDPGYWAAHPICRQAINRRVSGNPNEWPLDWFRRVHAATSFERGVSWGCGLGAFERAAVRCGVARRIDAFDISPKSLEDARLEAQKEGIAGIEYALGDFDDPRLPPNRYDVAFFHASLHHVRRLERLFHRLRRALGPGAAVYVDEYVGPSRSGWSAGVLAHAQRLLEDLPPAARLGDRIPPPIERNDPSEAIRSGEIASFLRQELDLVEWRPCGGQLAALLFPLLRRDWTESEEGGRWVARLMELEDEGLARNSSATFYLVAYGRIRRRPIRLGAGELASRWRNRLRARFPPPPRTN